MTRLGSQCEVHDGSARAVHFIGVKDALDEVVIDKPLADGLFLVGACIARATGGRAGVEHDGGAAGFIQAGVHVLHPTPIGRRLAGKARAWWETGEFVVVVVRFGKPVLVPHGVGNHAVEGAQFARRGAEFGVLEGVANFDFAFHVVDDQVHVGHGPGVGDIFLAIEFQRRKARRLFALGLRQHGDLTFDQQAARAAAGVVDFHARFWPQHLRHDGADLRRGVELAGTLAAAFSEFADQVFVAFANDVRFNIIKAKPLGANGFDEIG